MKLKTDLNIKYLIKKPIIIKNNPVFLIIHGYGDNEKNLFNKFTSNLPENFITISIRGLYKKYTNNSYYWFEINTLNQKNIQVNYLDILYSQKHIILFIKKILKKYQLKYSKIWLCGFSQGAYLANIISLDDIIKINYVLSLSGFILNNTVIKNNKSIFFISHGLYDSIISIELAKKMVVSLSKHKVKLTYKTYLMDHEINQTNYQDLMQWIHINNMQ
jgi:phospholipase/carboxylesterase